MPGDGGDDADESLVYAQVASRHFLRQEIGVLEEHSRDAFRRRVERGHETPADYDVRIAVAGREPDDQPVSYGHAFHRPDRSEPDQRADGHCVEPVLP